MASSLPARPKIPAGPTRHVYDVLVLGGQLGGLLAACLLAKRGYRVLSVEHDGLGAGYEHDGFVLPYAPFIAPSLKAMPAVEEAFAELGLQTHYQRAIRPHQPELQLALADARVDLPAQTEDRKRELTRALGKEGGEVEARVSALAAHHERTDAFFKASRPLPPSGFIDRWRLTRQARSAPGLETTSPLGASEPESLLSRLLPFVSFLDAPEAPLAQSRPLSQVFSFPGRLPQGRQGLRELLERRLVELGGDSLSGEAGENAVVETLSFDGGRAEGAKLVRSDHIYRASALVIATDSGALRRLVPDKKRHRRLTEALDASEVRSFLFSVNHVLPASALPRGLGELVLLESGDDELGPMLVQVLPARREGGKEEESLRVVCGAAFVPASARELGEKHLTAVAARLSAALERLMPFSARHRVLSSAPYLHAAGVRGSRLLPHPHFAFEDAPSLGVGGLPQRTPVRNLFLANREVLPGLGLEGELIAGIRAGELVHELLKKRKPL